MTIWVGTLLSACMLLAVSSSVASAFKCYRCLSTSIGECETNQTAVDCLSKLVCATVQYTQEKDGVQFGTVYMKNCLPPSSSCAFLNHSGLIQNCSVSLCSRDYCNGVPPTTPATIVTKATSAFTSQEESTVQATDTRPPPGQRNQAPSTKHYSSVCGVLLYIFLSLPCMTLSY